MRGSAGAGADQARPAELARRVPNLSEKQATDILVSAAVQDFDSKRDDVSLSAAMGQIMHVDTILVHVHSSVERLVLLSTMIAEHTVGQIRQQATSSTQQRADRDAASAAADAPSSLVGGAGGGADTAGGSSRFMSGPFRPLHIFASRRESCARR